MFLTSCLSSIVRLGQLALWASQGSGWTVRGIKAVYLDFAHYVPLQGGSYEELPPVLKRKKAIINIKNMDNECLRVFFWALSANECLVPHGRHPERPSQYPVNDGLEFTGVSFPTPLSEIQQVERQNNLAMNVFS